jgi:hypothetical protein
VATERPEQERHRAVSLRHGRLADGMAIAASIRARLLGMRLLRLDADVSVLPTSPRVRGSARLARGDPPPRAAGLSARVNGSGSARIGGDLAAAARLIEEGASELSDAREGMPAGPNGD